MRTHSINDKQMLGSPEVGHGGVRNLSNEDLIRFGGPKGDDPISGFRRFQADDTVRLPGSEIVIRGGHHRIAEIARRVKRGEIDPNTLIMFRRSPY